MLRSLVHKISSAVLASNQSRVFLPHAQILIPAFRRNFSSQDTLQDQAREALRLMKDESGESIMDSKLVESISVSTDREITVKLHLNKNYRKAKHLITTHLTA